MREQQQVKLNGFEMDEREKKINRQKLKEIVKANPDRYKRKARKLGIIKSRNVNQLQLKTEQSHTERKEFLRPEKSVDNIKTLDFTKNKRDPNLMKKELRIQQPQYLDENENIFENEMKTRTPSLPPQPSIYKKTIQKGPKGYSYAKNNSEIQCRQKNRLKEDKLKNNITINSTYNNIGQGIFVVK